MLAAFDAQDGHEDDGHGSARAWLRWQTRVTKTAAVAAVAWSRRLDAHPVIAQALAHGEISASWARAICGWSERLPEDRRDDADQILAGAALQGAELADLAGLAEQMYERSRQHRPDGDDDGFADRGVGLDITFRGAGRLNGDLTPGCAAALSTVLEALGKRAGPEDTRTAFQRRHDALEEACRRLIAAGMVPDRAGQPTQVQVHMTLSQLRGLPGASEAEAAWAAARARQPGWLTGPAATPPPATPPWCRSSPGTSTRPRSTGWLRCSGPPVTLAGCSPPRPLPGFAPRCWPWRPTPCPARAASPPGCAARRWAVGPAAPPACRWTFRFR